jgi:hypothetical protein
MTTLRRPNGNDTRRDPKPDGEQRGLEADPSPPSAPSPPEVRAPQSSPLSAPPPITPLVTPIAAFDPLPPGPSSSFVLPVTAVYAVTWASVSAATLALEVQTVDSWFFAGPGPYWLTDRKFGLFAGGSGTTNATLSAGLWRFNNLDPIATASASITISR